MQWIKCSMRWPNYHRESRPATSTGWAAMTCARTSTTTRIHRSARRLFKANTVAPTLVFPFNRSPWVFLPSVLFAEMFIYIMFKSGLFKGDLPIDDKIGLTYGMCVSKQCTNNQVRSIVSNCNCFHSRSYLV